MNELTNLHLVLLDVGNIHKAAATYMAAFNGNPWFESWTIPVSTERLSEILDTPGQISVALINPDNGEVVALAAGAFESWHDGKNFHLKELCVNPKLHHQGFGKIILNTILAEAEKNGATNIYLNTARNSTAEGLYTKNGFRERQEIMMELPKSKLVNGIKSFEGLDLVALDGDNILASAASVYTAAFSAPPWNEGWTNPVSLARLTEIRNTPGQISLALIDHESGAVVALAAGAFESWYQGRVFQIKELCADPKRAGEGLDKKILDAIVGEANRNGAANIYLYTAKDNDFQKFFIENGFVQREEVVMELPRPASRIPFAVAGCVA